MVVLVALFVTLISDHDRRAVVGDRYRRPWTAWCASTYWRCRAARSKLPATLTRCCSIRPHDHARQSQATAFRPVSGVTEQELADAAQLASLADETPEGRSIVVLAKEKYGIRRPRYGRACGDVHSVHTAQTRMSGVDAGASSVRKGAVDAILNYVNGGDAMVVASGNNVRALQPSLSSDAAREIRAISDDIAKAGGTPLAVAKDGRLLGVVQLKDIVKGGIRERFAELRRMGIRTVMITGDNPMTAAAIAAESRRR